MSQVAGTYQAKDMLLQKYLAKVQGLIEIFEVYEIRHVPRVENSRADIPSNIANTKPERNNKSLI